ncbi:hypothetical protein AVEN_168556-1 [Araneus ventricosus]|uniref:Uncharacterized protein n=1 Tax=Araneus ventricosus TaxID=182803 RepID=A0A4Y2FR53_ARAVE|nr:hypothetical protein AVEN_168556-1 [Araneus ventricosus]
MGLTSKDILSRTSASGNDITPVIPWRTGTDLEGRQHPDPAPLVFNSLLPTNNIYTCSRTACPIRYGATRSHMEPSSLFLAR